MFVATYSDLGFPIGEDRECLGTRHLLILDYDKLKKKNKSRREMGSRIYLGIFEVVG